MKVNYILKKILFLTFFFFSVFKGFGQQFFSVTPIGTLQLITVTGNNLTIQNVDGCGGTNYYSIAISGNKIYYCTGLGSLYSGDIVPGITPAITNCKLIKSGIYTNALTIDSDGIFYFVNGYELFTFDPKTSKISDLGTMPYMSAGDLMFYKNELYMASNVGVVKVPINDPSKSSMFISGVNAIFLSITPVIVNGITKVYGGGEQFVEIDMINRHIKSPIGPPTQSYDLGSAVEAGTIAKVEVDNLNINRECNLFNKARVQIYAKADGSQHTYTVNGANTNKTGIFDLSPGRYHVIVRSSANMLQKDLDIVVPDYTLTNPIITATTVAPTCVDQGQIKLDAGTLNSNYDIKYNNTVYSFNYTFTNLSEGSYHFTIINKAGCIIDQKDYVLQSNCPITVNNIQIQKQCDAVNKAAITVITATHPGLYTYTLNTGESNTSGIFNELPPGNYQVTVTSTGNQQPVTKVFTVPDYSINIPVITVTQKNISCNPTGQIKLDAGTANPDYVIKFGNDIFNFDHVFDGLIAGTYHFIILDKNGCLIDKKDYTLIQDVCLPVVISSLDVLQQCDAFNKAQLKVICAPDNTLHTFTLNTGQVNTTGLFDGLSPGNYQLNITSDGDRSSITTAFAVPDYTVNTPAVKFIPKNPVCVLPGQLKLDAGTANSLYNIKFNNDVFNFDHVFEGLAAGTYHFTILSKAGCIIDEKDYTLRQDECPPIVIRNIETAAECDVYGKTSLKVITQASIADYTYTLNEITNSTGIFDYLLPGTYNLTVNSSLGTSISRDIVVPDYTLNKPTISYKAKNAVCSLPGQINFTATGGTTTITQVKHGPDVYSINETIKGLPAGSNSFIFLNSQGCIVDMADIEILQDDCNPVVLPNTFTPNGDDINDIFRPNQDSNPLDYRLLIYNRWGKLLFQSQSVFTGWNGTYDGKPAPFGVYYWVVNYKMADGVKKTQSGYVTLLR